jgi:RNA-binding protein 39
VKVAESAEEKVLRDRIRDQCTVLVSSLPVTATARDIATYFSQCGTIRDVRLITDRNQKVAKGFAYVEFETPDQSTGALSLTGKLFQNRTLVVAPTQNEKNRANEAKEAAKAAAGASALPTKVYVGSLHFNVTEDAVRSIFQPFGQVLEVQLHREANGVSKGFGFITFATPQEAKRAITELNGLEVLGRPIKVNRCFFFVCRLISLFLFFFLCKKVGECKGSEGLMASAGLGGSSSGGGAADGSSSGMGSHLGGEDDERLEGDDAMVLNQATRSLLMAKLQRDQSVAAGASITGVNLPTSALVQQAAVVAVPSRCIVLQDCFDAAQEDARPDNAGWETEIESDVKSECEVHGKVNRKTQNNFSGL